MNESWRHKYIETNGIRMHYVTQGAGPLILLLHGFPEFWYSWRHQIPVLAQHFWVVAPDLRGYNETDKPEGVENYALPVLTADILGLIRALGKEKATIVGHDWGAFVAWTFAMTYPVATERLIIMNVPHPAVAQKKIPQLPSQLQKSWYIFFFQTPEVPERVLSRNNYVFLRQMLRRSALKKETFSEEDLDRYVEAMAKPGALTAAINYYRANANPAFLFSETPLPFPQITAPTLVIWGEEDIALEKALSEGAEDYVDAPYTIRYIPGCSHWVQQEEPELVNRYILEFLQDLIASR